MSNGEQVLLQRERGTWHVGMPALSVVGCVALAIIGLLVSLRTVMGLFGIEADTSHSLMLWYGMTQHGVGWVRDWLFTQDNWLLSLVPLHFAAFAVWGPKVSIVLFLGWVFFVASAVLAGVIAWRVGARRVAVFVFLALLNLNEYAHLYGFVSYSTSHNITNLMGIASLLVMMSWVSRPRGGLLVVLFALLVCGAVSDPWMLASYNVPLLGLCAWLWYRPLSHLPRRQVLVCSAVLLMSMVAVATKLFGLFDFLPYTHFRPGTWDVMNNNAIYLIRNLGGMLGLLPFTGANSFISGFVSLAAIVALIGYAARRMWLARLGLSLPGWVFMGFAALSTLCVIGAFVVTAVEAKDYSARFLINVVYLVVIALGILAERAWAHAGPYFKRAVFAAFGLLLLTSWVTNWSHLIHGPLRFRDTGVTDVVSFFKEHGLSYGYGPYWGANANAVTAGSLSEVIIRPAVFEHDSGMMRVGGRAESSRRWYTDEDVPPGTSRYFVMLRSDGEECPRIEVCVQGLTRQFGAPVTTLTRGDAQILVWDHPLLGYIAPPLSIARGRAVAFGALDSPVTGEGWSERESWGVWTDGPRARLRFDVNALKGQDVELTVRGHAFVTEQVPAQTVTVLANGAKVGELHYSLADSGGERKLVLPRGVVDARPLELEFAISQPVSPLETGRSTDPRKLGLGLESLVFN
jgi:hypothetical protein